MKSQRFRKFLRCALPTVLVLAAATAWYVNRTPASPFDGANAAEPNPALLARGEYVARLGDCVACHSTPDGKPFAGGLEMPTPMGAIFTTNITPDKATGIGSYSLAEFDRAVRLGVAKDGHRLYPAMPYPSYAKLGDDDVRALYAYFSHEVRPVQQPNKASEIPWPLNMRWPLALWNGIFTDTGPYQADPKQDAAWNRGAFIVQGPGHCGACHTPRGWAMNEKGLDEGSDQFLAGALIDNWYAPSLRGDGNLGLGRWNEAEIAQFLKSGRNRHAVVFGSMTEVFNNSTQYMTDADLQAVAHYLKSVPAASGSDASPWQYAAASNGTAQPRGASTYMAKCSACHGADGRGQGQWIPPLAGSAASLASIDASSINATLNGSGRVVANGIPDNYRMPPFRNQLSDQEIADVLSYVRTSWGNTGGTVDAKDVQALRAKTSPASSSVMLLKTR